MLHFSALAISFALGFSAKEQAPIVTDRPDFTESSSVVPLRALQLESGFTFERPNGDVKSLGLPEVLLRYGIADRFEIRVGLPNYQSTEISGSARIRGFGDTYVGAKYELGTWGGTAFAVIPAVFIPSGHRDVRSEEASPEVKLVYSRDLPRDLSLSGMIYVAQVTEDGDKVTPVQHTISVGIPVREKVGMFIEHVLDVQKDLRPAHTLHSGFTYQPKPNMQFDIHYGFGLTRTAPDFFIGAGFSIRF